MAMILISQESLASHVWKNKMGENFETRDVLLADIGGHSSPVGHDSVVMLPPLPPMLLVDFVSFVVLLPSPFQPKSNPDRGL